MKKLVPYIAAFFFAVFVLGVFAAMMLYSWQGLANIFPDDILGQSFGMLMFDIAALIWFGLMVYRSRSTAQYVIAFIGFMVGLLGTLGLIGIEVGLSSGMLEVGSMQKPLTYIFIAVLVAHVILIYSHHAASPEMSADISLGIEKAKITDEAMKQAEKQLQDNLPMLAGSIASDLVKRVMQDLNLIPASNQVIDLPALDVKDASVENNQGGAQNFFWNWVRRWGIGERKFGLDVPNVDPNFQPVTPKPSPAQTDAGNDEAADDGAKK